MREWCAKLVDPGRSPRQIYPHVAETGCTVASAGKLAFRKLEVG